MKLEELFETSKPEVKRLPKAEDAKIIEAELTRIMKVPVSMERANGIGHVNWITTPEDKERSREDRMFFVKMFHKAAKSVVEKQLGPGWTINFPLNSWSAKDGSCISIKMTSF